MWVCFNAFHFFLGPRVDFIVRRSKLPSEDLMKQACRKPKELKVSIKKNVSVDGLGTIHGRVHIGKQDINKIQTRKMKGLKKTSAEKREERKLRKRSLTGDIDSDTAKKQKTE